MYNKSLYLVCSILILVMTRNVRALESFSIRPIHDSYVSNEPDAGPDTKHHSSSYLYASNTSTMRRVSYIVFDISELEGQPLRDVIFDMACQLDGLVNIYGIIEELDDLIDETTLTWNNAPGVQNEPVPPVGDLVALDFNDLTDVLLRFDSSTNWVMGATEPNQAIDDFINSDEDGIVAFMFAPAEEGVSIYIRSKESYYTYFNSYNGPYLEGLFILPEHACRPNPTNRQTEVARDMVLSWTSGRYAGKHDVYFGTDPNNLNHVATKPLGDENYSFSESLQFNQTCYWRVDEVNEAEPNSPWEGNIWSFTAANFIVMDDFEDYNEMIPPYVWDVWVDGWYDPDNGSIVGGVEIDFIMAYASRRIVREGDNSMAFLYYNEVGLSEATRTFTSSMRDWTREDVVTLTLFYYGDSTNAAEPMYVAVDGDAIVVNDDPNAALNEEWTRWDIPLQVFEDMGRNLKSVDSLSIGFGNKTNPVAGGSGLVFFDDIRFYRQQ
jgi:hypothetical protein